MHPFHEDPRLHAAATALRSAVHAQLREPSTAIEHDRAFRFVTICRQSGSGGRTLANGLCDALNTRGRSDRPWLAWDQSLIDHVVTEHGLERELVENLETRHAGWFEEFLSGFSSSNRPNEFRVYRRVTATIRSLAAAGNAVIVGRGGAFITDHIPGGLHIRLVAPLEDRILRMQTRQHLTLHEAAAKVHETDKSRESFYHRYWPRKTLAPESFTLTINTATLTDGQLIDCVLPLVLRRRKSDEAFIGAATDSTLAGEDY